MSKLSTSANSDKLNNLIIIEKSSLRGQSVLYDEYSIPLTQVEKTILALFGAVGLLSVCKAACLAFGW